MKKYLVHYFVMGVVNAESEEEAKKTFIKLKNGKKIQGNFAVAEAEEFTNED